MIQKIVSLKVEDVVGILKSIFYRITLKYLNLLSRIFYLLYLHNLKLSPYKPVLNLSLDILSLPQEVEYSLCNDPQENTLSLYNKEEFLTSKEDTLDYPLIPLIPFNIETTMVNKSQDNTKSFRDKVINYFIFNFKP